MFGLLTAKNFAAAMESLQSGLVLLASETDERLQRRQQSALESLVDDGQIALSPLKRLAEENPPTAVILPLAENFILWRSGQSGSDRGLDTLRPSWRPFWSSTA